MRYEIRMRGKETKNCGCGIVHVRVWVVQELYVQNESIIVNLCDENKRKGESIHRKGETEKKEMTKQPF